jgi:hypothetical protein
MYRSQSGFKAGTLPQAMITKISDKAQTVTAYKPPVTLMLVLRGIS